MKNTIILIFGLFMVGCNGSGGGSSNDPVYVGVYQTDCNVSGSDSWRGQLTLTANTYHYTAFSFTGNTVCSGAGIEGSYPAATPFTIAQSSSTTFLLSDDQGDTLLIKVFGSTLIMDVAPDSTYSPDWDYVADGSYEEFTKQ